MPLLLNSRCIDLALIRPAEADVKIESTDQQFLAISANYSQSANDRIGSEADIAAAMQRDYGVTSAFRLKADINYCAKAKHPC